MELKHKLTAWCLRHYGLVTVVMVAVTVAAGAMIPRIRVDTDPENMLDEDEPVRVFHDKAKERFVLHDMVVVGVVNEKHEHGVYNPASLRRIYELTQFAKTKCVWPSEEEPGKEVGVVEVDLLAPSTVDHIGQGGPGEVRFEWLMPEPPETQEAAIQVRSRALENPLLKGTVVSDTAVCIYLPLTSKDLSHRVYTELQKKIATFEGDEEYHITGLPVAEDTFGHEMFVQMAISAPTAMAVIFVLMLLFFRKIVLVISPMIIALVSVVCAMGLLIGLGFPVHIMSSMIPIFLMPIAVVDSVHILSEFFDVYTAEKGRKESIHEVMGNLFMPMLYTSLTSAAGFASLSLTPIPPVQVFGIFVAIGIMIAWLCTITFVPAYVMLLRDKWLAGFGAAAVHEEKQTWLTGLLHRMGTFTSTRSKPILAVVGVVVVISGYGISRIRINDNPIKWFEKGHPIRVADTVLNRHFAGTYMAYLVLDEAEPENVTTEYVNSLRGRFLEKSKQLKEQFEKASDIAAEMEKLMLDTASKDIQKKAFLDKLIEAAGEKEASAELPAADVWYEFMNFFELETERLKVFKRPEVLKYISQMQQDIGEMPVVGKTNSVSDIVKKVHQELIDGRPENYIIPDSSPAVAQCLIQFQSSHTPDDLWHFVTYDYDAASIWFQLKSGDNRDMERVVTKVNGYFGENPPPAALQHRWAGLTYINVVWQDKMVRGMIQSLIGSFVIVFVMMSILFRSPLWGVLCMAPLSITIAVIYGIIGLAGKDYDMPVAVLSALTLGMAVDFAIHFLERSRMAYASVGSWRQAVGEMFGEPARAISRNVLVIAIGFLPLLAAPLIPYKTVGMLVCVIMALSGAVTLLVLPSLLSIGERHLFAVKRGVQSPACNCLFCIIISTATALLVAVNLHQYRLVGWSALVIGGIIFVAVMGMSCGIASRREACKTIEEQEQKEKGDSV